MTDSVQSAFTADDGEHIAVIDWPLPEVMTPRAVVVMVHGLGEHIWRYHQVALSLNSWGYAVRGYDQYGHGESGGPRGAMTSERRLVNDLADVVDDTRRMYGERTPLVVLGHSMGGVVAADLVRQHLRGVDGLVLSSPALNPGLSAVQKLMLATLPALLPNLRVSNGLQQEYLCRDVAVVNAYAQDRLVHDRVSARLARYIARAGELVRQAAPDWATPTLLMYAGLDRLVSPQGSAEFARRAPSEVVKSHCFETMFHEILNDPHRDLVLAMLKAWLRERF